MQQLRYNRQPRDLHAGWRLGIFLLLLILFSMIVAGVFFLLHLPPQRRNGVLQPFPLLATGIAALGIAFGATAICVWRVDGRTMPTVGLPPGRQVLTSGLVGLSFGAIVPLTILAVLWFSGAAAVTPSHLGIDDLLVATLPMVLATVLLSSWEEIAFRGYAMQMLAGMGGPWVATTVTGILFGLAHSGNPGANVLGFLNTALNGALLGWIVARSGSLLLACGYHAGWNLMASVILGLRDSGTFAPGSLLTTSLSGPSWLSGGTYGFEASLLTGVAESIVLGLLLLNVSRLPSVAVAKPYFMGSATRRVP